MLQEQSWCIQEELEGVTTHIAGGGANHLCMPLDPEYTLSYKAGVRCHCYVYGAKYEFPLQGTYQHNVLFALCYVSTREVVCINAMM